jgi:GNAT superfamily N-acetyltransferase
MILTRPIPQHPKWFGYTGSSTTYRPIPVCQRAQAGLYVVCGRLGEIGDLYVLSEHRLKGLARRLVEPRLSAVRRAVGLRHHHTDGRAAAWAQSILRQARLRPVWSNERFSNIGRLIASPPTWPCGMVHRQHLLRPYGITLPAGPEVNLLAARLTY